MRDVGAAEHQAAPSILQAHRLSAALTPPWSVEVVAGQKRSPVAKILAASLIGARLNVLQLAPLFIQLGLLLAGFTELLLIRLLLLLIQLGLLLAGYTELLLLLLLARLLPTAALLILLITVI
jgi:hypothetical protein